MWRLKTVYTAGHIVCVIVNKGVPILVSERKELAFAFLDVGDGHLWNPKAQYILIGILVKQLQPLKPRLRQGNMLPERATCCRQHTCWRQHVARKQVARSGNMLPVSRKHNYTIQLCHGRLVSLCIQQQTGNKLTKILLQQATCCLVYTRLNTVAPVLSTFCRV